jgi:hypothetical protein
MAIFTVPNPIVVAANRIMVVASAETGPFLYIPWPEWSLELDAPPPLTTKWLHDLKDDAPFMGPGGKRPWPDLTEDEKATWLVFHEALVNSNLVPAELFKKAGQENSYVTYDHLSKRPNEYRGKVVPVVGRMLRLRKWPTTARAAAQGIDFVYEASVAGQTPNRPPYSIYFLTPPDGLEPAETMDRPVKFYGYFIKKFRYEGDKGKHFSTHLLVGPTVTLEAAPPAPPPETPYTRMVLFAIAGGCLGLTALIVAMTLWFRRGDRAIQDKLALLRDRQPLNLDGEAAANPEEPAVRHGEP